MVEDLFDVSSDGSFVLKVQVQPGAGKTAVVGRHGDALKLKVAAPPEHGRANEACAALIAEIVGVKSSAVTLTSGGSSRSKRFAITGIEQDDLAHRLRVALEEAPLGGGTAKSRDRQPGSQRR